MPIQTEVIDLAEEVERLEAEREDLVDDVASLDEGNPERRELIQEGQELDAYLDGLDAVRDPPQGVTYPPVARVEFGGLTGGEYGQIEDQLTNAVLKSGEASVGGGAMRVHTVAKGTLDADYLEGGESYEERVAATAGLPLGYLKWAEDRIDDLTSVGGNGRESFGDLLRERSVSESSPSADAN